MTNGKRGFLYQKVYDQIKEKIIDNQLKPGDRLENEAELQKKYAVSRDTLRKALSCLERDGLIVRKPALGTFVKRNKSDYSLFKMKSFSEQMQARGIVPSSELISIELSKRIAPEIAQMLQISAQDRCYIISRIRKGDGEPYSYEVAYIPYKLCPDLQQHLDESASLYYIYENVYHHVLSYGKMTLEAEMPSETTQELLELPEEVPVLKMTCLFFLDNHVPLYYVVSDYIGNKYYFSTEVPR